jgi:hypothetical protein
MSQYEINEQWPRDIPREVREQMAFEMVEEGHVQNLKRAAQEMEIPASTLYHRKVGPL